MAGSPPPSTHGGGRDASMRSSSSSASSACESEWTADSVLAALSSCDANSARMERLAAWASRGEVRDLDDSLWANPSFYQSMASSLRSAWRAHDRAVLGAVSDDEHENFMYDQSRAAGRHTRMDSGMDDEEDEEGVGARHEDGFAVQEAWRTLSACYTFVSRALLAPEMRPEAARKRGGFDAPFAAALVARFEPQFRKKSAAAPNAIDGSRVTQAQLAAVTGVGGVAVGSKVPAQLAHVPASILSMVGIGVKHPEPDSPTPQELSILRGLLHTLYTRLLYLRPSIRNLIGNFLQRFLRNATYPQGLNEILAVYGSVVRGLALPLRAEHHDFLVRNLLPLHQPNQMLNELSPVLGVYHEALVYVLIQFLEKDAATAHMQPVAAAMHAQSASGGGSLCELIMNRILLGWPNARAANSPKEVLLLHECEKILEFCPTDAQLQLVHAASGSATATATAADSSPAAAVSSSSAVFKRIIAQFLPYLVQCISSYNHRVSARALQLWQNDRFLSLCRAERGLILPALLPALVNEERHWNASVNKMRGIVLGLFRDMDLVLFTRLVHEHYLVVHELAHPEGPQATFTPAQSLAKIDALIASLRPPPPPAASAESALLATQIRVASSLPAQVKYSDFVFGHLLGEGSFSQVRYAKWVQRGALPSAWPEFAVKILNKELVAQQKYENNVQREIQIMNKLAHENINRLVALCDNATNTYLVLEYAHKGDLHTHITTLGSLDVDSARFVAAEILRGMEEIHRNEIVFVDLKPENVLVHQSGHIKLSDFGSSRFFDEVGLGESEGRADRLEGTADYLAPELLRGGAISPASDLWAFACVLYQMLAGRTPIWAGDVAPPEQPSSSSSAASAAGSGAKSAQQSQADDASLTPAERQARRDAAMAQHEAAQKSHMLSKMVQFESAASSEERYPDSFDAAARDLIDAIMVPDPARRIAVHRRLDAQGQPVQGGVQWLVDYSALHSHPFFSGLDFASLPTLPAPQLAGGRVAPAPADAQWARRKNSIMWAPMPKSYTFAEGGGGVVMDPIAEEPAKEAAAVAGGVKAMSSARSAGASSLRAQMFSNKSGTLAAPRFSSLKEGAEEGEDADADMKLTEGSDEDEEDEDEEMEDEEDGPGLHGRMLSAPLPVAAGGGSSLPPRPPSKPSSRASGPMAVVEAARDDDVDTLAQGSLPLYAQPSGAGVGAGLGRPPVVRPSLGLRSNLPPSGAAAAGVAGGGGGARPSSSFVPLADATAGPKGLGMGLRRMGNPTASALLARVLNKAPNGQAAGAPNAHHVATTEGDAQQ